MAEKHAANREAWVALNTKPDWCEVDGDIIPFDISRTLDHELVNYAKTVFIRGQPAVMLDSVAQGTDGDAGSGVTRSTVSRGSGHVWIREGSPSVFVEGRPLARHMDKVLMNCKKD